MLTSQHNYYNSKKLYKIILMFIIKIKLNTDIDNDIVLASFGNWQSIYKQGYKVMSSYDSIKIKNFNRPKVSSWFWHQVFVFIFILQFFLSGVTERILYRILTQLKVNFKDIQAQLAMWSTFSMPIFGFIHQKHVQKFIIK